MDSIAEQSGLLLSRLPQITSLKELIELSCSLLQASLYLVDAQGVILEHSDETAATCPSWLNAVTQGRLSEEHRKSVLTPEVNCNVVRDKGCQGAACARLSITIQVEEDALPGAVVVFLWQNDTT